MRRRRSDLEHDAGLSRPGLDAGGERVALALFKTHGLDVAKWPAEVRDVLALA
jgi:hypothetical protein